MTDRRRSLPSCLTRRRLLAASLAAGAVAAAGPASAGLKGTKEAAHYREKPGPSPQDCSSCHNFLDPTECLVIEGDVSPWGYCDWYVD